jgi:apolipoprotein N-acyltransferase
MIGHRVQRVLLSRYAFAGVAGLLLAFAFPKFSLAGLAWVAPGLMVGAALGRTGWERFRIGYVAGLIFYLVQLYWLLNIPFKWHGVPVGPAAGWLALCAYMALFPAVWVWLVSGLFDRKKGEGGATALPGWLGRAGICLYAAAAWVALEMVIARLFSGFPWDLLGVSQYKMLPLIQVASVSGVYGVSFLVIWVSTALLMAAVMMLRNPGVRSVALAEVALPLLVVALLFNSGFRELRRDQRMFSRELTVAMVQPSIPQTLIWDPDRDGRAVRRSAAHQRISSHK